MLNFQKEWTPDELHLRDLYQFELKSEVNFNKELPERSFTQEFYLFVPQALQIDKKNYSKEEFYRDHTHFTRLKTPEFTLEQLSNTTNPTTPFYKILNEKKTFLRY